MKNFIISVVHFKVKLILVHYTQTEIFNVFKSLIVMVMAYTQNSVNQK